MASSIPAPPFARLSQLEDMVRVALSSAEGDASRRLVIAPEAYVERVLRADFLRWLLLEAIPHLALPLVHFELCDSKVEGKLDLAGVESGMLLRFFNCEFAERIDLSDAKISGFGLMGCRAYEIRADRFETKGSFSVSAAYLDDDDAQRPMKECPSIVSQQLRFCGARISGNLDLRGGTFGDEDGSDEPAIFADGAHIEGNAFLGAGFRAFGEVRLNGSTIERNLDLTAAKLENLRGYSLSAAGAHVVGSVYLGDTEADGGTFESRGSFRLEGAKIDGDVKCDGARFAAAAFLLRDYRPPSADEEADKYLYAVEANGAEIGGDLTFSGSFEAWGIVDLIGAKIDGDLNCETGCFSFPGEDALCADGITVSGTTFLDSGLTTNGVLRFPQASLKQGLVIREVVFDLRAECRGWQCGATTAKQLNFPAPGMFGIFAPLAEVDGKISWNKIRKRDSPESTKRLWLHLAGAKADAIDIQSNEDWQVFDRFDVTDFDYKTILHLPPDIAWRMDELDRHSVLRSLELCATQLWLCYGARIHLPESMDNELSEWVHNFKDVAHHIGGTRMADSAQRGVVDRNCRVHGVQNLYLAGSSVFPTSGESNPTLTIVALALRLAEELKAALRAAGGAS